MFKLSKPSTQEIAEFWQSHKDSGFTYKEVGMTQPQAQLQQLEIAAPNHKDEAASAATLSYSDESPESARGDHLKINSYRFNSKTDVNGATVIPNKHEPVRGYIRDHNRANLGSGESTYKEAIAALKQWRQFDLGWVQICTPEKELFENSVVCLCVHIPPVWALFACRIVYLIDESDSAESPIKKFGFGYGTLDGHPESGEERFLIEWNTADDTVWFDILAYSKPGNFLFALGKPFARLMQKRFARNSMGAMRRALATTSDNARQFGSAP